MPLIPSGLWQLIVSSHRPFLWGVLEEGARDRGAVSQTDSFSSLTESCMEWLSAKVERMQRKEVQIVEKCYCFSILTNPYFLDKYTAIILYDALPHVWFHLEQKIFYGKIYSPSWVAWRGCVTLWSRALRVWILVLLLTYIVTLIMFLRPQSHSFFICELRIVLSSSVGCCEE